jgi:hypothetical protein
MSRDDSRFYPPHAVEYLFSACGRRGRLMGGRGRYPAGQKSARIIIFWQS